MDISCGFIGAPRARALWMRKWRSDVVRVRFHGIAKPQRDFEGHVSELPFWVLRGRKKEQEESESESVFVSLTRNRWVWHQSGSGFGQELFDGLVSAVVLTDFHRAGEMEFHSGFDLACTWV